MRLLSLLLITSGCLSSSLLMLPLCWAAESAAPTGWMIKGDKFEKYDIGLDKKLHQGKPTIFMKSLEGKIDGLSTLKQTMFSKNYLGKRVRFSASVKTEDLKDAAGLWMRIDDASHKVLEFDNMENRPIKGSTDWKQYSVVLDVPLDSETIHFGVLISDAGKLWANDFVFDVVGKDVPSTNLVSKDDKWPYEPVNLDLSEKKQP